MRLRICGLAELVALLTTALPSRAQEGAERSYASENFSITWTAEGNDAPDPMDADGDGIPDGIVRMVEAFELARAFIIEDLGYREPPSDGLYPLYVAVGDDRGYARELPGGNGRSKPSFVVVPPRLVASDVSLDRMKVFAVHEYHHAVQIGYDSDESMWIREATSSWLEDVFVDTLDPNHRYLPAFLLAPQRTLTDVDRQREYGAFLFLQFLVERYAAGDPGIVRELWEEMAVPEAIPAAPDRRPLDAIETVLARRGVSMEDAWGEYLMWQRHLSHFEEGSAYRAAVAGTGWPPWETRRTVRRESCRIDAGGGTVAAFSGAYALFKPDARSTRSRATIAVKGSPGSTGYYAIKPFGAPATEHRFQFDANGVARADVPFAPGAIKNVSLGVGRTNEGSPELGYSLRVEGARATVAKLSGSSSTTFFTPLSLSGTVLCGRDPARAADVVLTATEAGSGEVTSTPIVTDDHGEFRLSVSPDAKTVYEVSVVDPLLAATTSTEHVVEVRLFTSIEVPEDPVHGRRVTIAGAVAPPHPGATVLIQFRRPERDWRLGATVTQEPDGRYSAEVTFPRDGVWQVRSVALPGDDDHISGTSVTRFVRLL